MGGKINTMNTVTMVTLSERDCCIILREKGRTLEAFIPGETGPKGEPLPQTLLALSLLHAVTEPEIMQALVDMLHIRYEEERLAREAGASGEAPPPLPEDQSGGEEGPGSETIH